MKLFLDVNVVLDVLNDREPHAEDSAYVLQRVEQEQDEGLLCALTFPILDYLLTRNLPQSEARALLRDLRTFLDVAPVDDRVVDRALNSDIQNYEDAVQYYSAIDAGAEALITRNLNDFPAGELNLFTPEEYRVFNQ